MTTMIQHSDRMAYIIKPYIYAPDFISDVDLKGSIILGNGERIMRFRYSHEVITFAPLPAWRDICPSGEHSGPLDTGAVNAYADITRAVAEGMGLQLRCARMTMRTIDSDYSNCHIYAPNGSPNVMYISIDEIVSACDHDMDILMPCIREHVIDTCRAMKTIRSDMNGKSLFSEDGNPHALDIDMEYDGDVITCLINVTPNEDGGGYLCRAWIPTMDMDYRGDEFTLRDGFGTADLIEALPLRRDDCEWIKILAIDGNSRVKPYGN